jgi:hypothetical protein
MIDFQSNYGVKQARLFPRPVYYTDYDIKFAYTD